MTAQREQWKPVKGYESKYTISDKGRIKSLTTGIVRKQRKHYKYGYALVDLKSPGNNKTVQVHRLVASHFLPNMEEAKIQVNHKNGTKHDSSLSNLEWVTPSENCLHAHATGLYGRYTVKKHVRKKKNGASVIRQHYRKK